MTDNMSDAALRSKDAVRYNQVIAEAAEGLLKELTHPEIREWVTSIAKQHRFHEKRHRRNLKKLSSTAENSPQEAPKEEKTIEEQQAEFAAEQEAKA